MGLECANCGSNETINAVCHHCGKPLCEDQKNCRFEIQDEAFRGTEISPLYAFHCRECLETFHPDARLK